MKSTDWHVMRRQHLVKTPYSVVVIASDDVLLVTLRFEMGADRDALECCMFRVADALAAIEQLSEKELRNLLWEQKRLSPTEQCITLQRRFSDPEYPQKFDVAFQRLDWAARQHAFPLDLLKSRRGAHPSAPMPTIVSFRATAPRARRPN